MPILDDALLVLMMPFASVFDFLISAKAFGLNFGYLLISSFACYVLVHAFISPYVSSRPKKGNSNSSKSGKDGE